LVVDRFQKGNVARQPQRRQHPARAQPSSLTEPAMESAVAGKRTRKGAEQQKERGRLLEPGLARFTPPPFHQLHEHDFEELNCAIICTEAGVSSCDLYGVRGQTQHGADLVAPLNEANRIDVVQCKCYAEFSPRKMVQASDKFLEHWDTVWRHRNVRRFILVVACSLTTIKCQQEIARQTERLAALGVVYEAWSARILANKLASHPQIVGKFLDPAELWVKRLCGGHVQIAPVVGVAGLAGQLFNDASQRLLQRAADGVRAEIEAIRLMVRRGDIRVASERLAALQADQPVWATLEAALKAKVLRMQALLALQDRSDLSRPKQLAAEADLLDSGDGTRLHALISAREKGPAAGLAALAARTGETEQVAQLRASFLLELGQPSEAAACLEPWRKSIDHESRRLLALALLSCGQGSEAETLAREAMSLAPEAWAARMVLGVVLYYRGLAGAAVPGRLGSWPEPPPWHTVGRDDASVAHFREADRLFTELGTVDLQQAPRALMDAWRLGCQANDATRRADAMALCDRLLVEDRTNPAAIAWALARAFPIDLRRSQEALEDSVTRDGTDPERVSALATIHLVKGKPERALVVLQSNEATFRDAGVAEEWRALVAQASAAKGLDTSRDVATTMEARIALARAVRAGDHSQGEAGLAALADRVLSDEHDPALALECLLHLAGRKRWDLVAPRVDAILPGIATADAVHLAAVAKATAGDPRAALEIMDRYVGAFPGKRLPGDLRRLKVDCQRRLGQWPVAVSEAAALAREGGAAEDLLNLANLFVAMGNTRQAAITVRQARGKGPLSPPHALHFAYLLAHEDPALGRELWQAVSPDDLERRYLPLALDTAYRLGLAPQTKTVVRRLVEGPDDEMAQALSLDDLLRMLQARREEAEQLWSHHEQAKLPLHVLAPRLDCNLASLYHSDLDARERFPDTPGVLLAQHGSKRWLTREQFPPEPSGMRLIADVTALLLAHHVGVLDAVERCFRPVHVTQQVSFALQQMRDDALPKDPRRITDAERLLGLLASGRVQGVEVPRLEDKATTPEATSAEAKWLAAQAVTREGAIVDWSAPDESVPLASASTFMNPSGFIELLRLSGLLDDAAAQQARDAIGTVGEQPPLLPSLRLGAPIYFRGNTATAIVGSGVIERACEAFQVHVEQSEVQALHLELGQAEQGRELAGWVAGLIERVRRGLEDGTYEALPDTQRENHGDPALDESLAAGLRDLLAAAAHQSGGVIWADDRMLSAQWALGQASVIGTPDVLEALAIYGHLQENELEQKLLKLRAGHVLFIDPRSGEVGQSLFACRVENGVALEARDAAIHRRYLARGLLVDDRLRATGGKGNAQLSALEAGFVVNWARATDEAIRTVWSDKTTPLDACAARADIALQSLYVDQHRTLPLRANDNETSSPREFSLEGAEG